MTIKEYTEDDFTVLFVTGIILLLVIPIHLLIIIVLVKNRNNDNFSFPFFRMLISLTVNDIITCFVVGLGNLTLSMSHETIVAYMPVFHGTLLAAIIYAGMAGDMIILVAMGVNRLISYVFPLRAHTLWRPIHTRMAIVLQWLYAGTMCLAAIHPDSQQRWAINETNGVLWHVEPQSTIYYGIVFADIVGNFTGGLTLAIIYGICVGKLVHYKLNNASGATESSVSIEIRLAFQGAFLSSGLIAMEVMFAAIILAGTTFSFAVYVLFMVVYLSNFVLGPFIVIGMSSQIRKYIKLLFTQDNSVHVL